MQPRFTQVEDWRSAEALLQPALIRLVDNLRQLLETSSWQGRYEAAESPYPGQILCLRRGSQSLRVNLWQFCFQICCLDYPLTLEDGEEETQDVVIDPALLDADGAVDWLALDQKTRQVLGDFFDGLESGRLAGA
ncbi:MAG: hypothetical protein GC158_02565 [Cyanobacteria bacterium RI_101]|nr:hypothetical protein [Cyanobacteria bacterium RI_101]